MFWASLCPSSGEPELFNTA